MLSTPPFTRVLKILEEPPEHLMFILATTELQKGSGHHSVQMPTTQLPPSGRRTIAHRLLDVAAREDIGLQPTPHSLSGRLADGAMRDGCRF